MQTTDLPKILKKESRRLTSLRLERSGSEQKISIHRGQLILGKISKIGANMSDYMAKMHRIQFPLGLAPDPAGGSYALPLGYLRGLLLRGREAERKRMERGEG